MPICLTSSKLKLIALTVILFLFSSCSIQGLTDDYKKLDDDQQNIISNLKDFSELKSRNIYKLNAIQLRQEIKNHPKAMVYVFTNGCSSKSCRPMIVYENYARKNGYQLFLVMSGFGSLDQTMVQPFESPLFAIDAKYYDTAYRGKYTRLFMNGLEGLPIEDKRTTYESLFYFKNGEFVSKENDLPENF